MPLERCRQPSKKSNLLVILGYLCFSSFSHTATAQQSSVLYRRDGQQTVNVASGGFAFLGQPLIVSFGNSSADILAGLQASNLLSSNGHPLTGKGGNSNTQVNGNHSTSFNNNGDSFNTNNNGMSMGEADHSASTSMNHHQSNKSNQQNKKMVSIQFLRDYLRYFGEEWRRRANRYLNALWNREANLGNAQAGEELARFSSEYQSWVNSEWANNITRFDLSVLNSNSTASDVTQLRLFFQGSLVIGVSALSDEKFEQWSEVTGNMSFIYGTATICPYENRNCNKEADRTLQLQPDIAQLFRNSTKPGDYDKLLYMWTAWADTVGRPIRPFYIRYVQLLNEAARANGVPGVNNGADLYQRPYATPDFPQVVQKLLDDIMPFYKELHAFVRHRLRLHYGPRRVPARGPIPAHLISLNAVAFGNTFQIVNPFPGAELNLTAILRANNFTVQGMFQIPDRFFKSMGLLSLAEGAPRFFELSLLEPLTNGSQRVCHGSAWDFYATNRLPGDYRISMCAVVDESNFDVIGHEMGHIQYFMQYANLNPVFRDSPHPGFHEGIADFTERSVRDPNFLQSIGLIRNQGIRYEKNIPLQLTYLMQLAFNQVGSLPSTYAIDVWRWAVFNGSVPTSRMNTEFWNIRRRIQGVEPPVRRTEQDFDPATIFHVAFDYDVIRYFLATFLQFQFQQALCVASGQFDPRNPRRRPLHLCNVAGSREAGSRLKRMMEVGSSLPWQEVLFLIAGTRALSSAPLLTYFEPLRKYLRSYLAKNRVPVGWDNTRSNSRKVFNSYPARLSGNYRQQMYSPSKARVELDLGAA